MCISVSIDESGHADFGASVKEMSDDAGEIRSRDSIDQTRDGKLIDFTRVKSQIHAVMRCALSMT